MDKLTELYARSAYEGRMQIDIVGELRTVAAMTVLVAGLCLNVVAPLAGGWWLLDIVGLR